MRRWEYVRALLIMDALVDWIYDMLKSSKNNGSMNLRVVNLYYLTVDEIGMVYYLIIIVH
jgi:hypothetical protein